MSTDQLPINLFDLALVGVLVAGLLRGRKHGMSEELLGVLKWVAVLTVCAAAYEPIGAFFASSSHVLSLVTCYLMAYIGLALLILVIFAGIKRALGGKLLGSDIFGQAEYPLGMGSGLLRFTCMLLAALALLNARYFSPAEVKAMERFQDDVYGSNFFPTLHTLQSTVFERSLTGPWIKEHLSFLLIKPTEPEDKQIKQKEYTFPK
jgi:uncharacterized membrane protein required for colicin V production